MVKTVYLIRHPEIMTRGKYVGITDADLSEMGREQIKDITEYFKNVHLDAIISSPKKRCMLPAQKLSLAKNVLLNIDEDASEINFGLWEGLGYKEIMAGYPDEWDEYMAHPMDFTFPSGDNVSKYIHACVKDFEEIMSTGAGNIAFLTHAGYIRSVISMKFLRDKDRFFGIDCSYAAGYLIDERGFLKILQNS